MVMAPTVHDAIWERIECLPDELAVTDDCEGRGRYLDALAGVLHRELH